MLSGTEETNTKRSFTMPETGIYDLKKAICWLGFDPQTGKFGTMIFVYIVVLTVLISNAILYVFYNWEDVSKRLEGVKALVMYIMTVAYLMGLTSHWNETMFLIRTIETGFYKYSYRNTAKKMELKRKVEHNIVQLRWLWSYMLTSYMVSLYLAPVLIFIFRVIQNSTANITIEMLSTSLPFYYPENYETIAAYMVAYVLQCFYLNYAAWFGFITLVSAFNAMQLVEGELKLLRESLEEIGSIIRFNSATNLNNVSEKFFNENQNYSRDEKPMRRFLSCFLKHHYYIHRKVDEVTRGMQMVSFAVNSGMSVMLCTSIYSMTKSKALMEVVIEVIYSCILMFCLYCYGLMGERISTEDQHLRTALYECTWVDKPKWFQKSLLIIMTRTSRTIEMKCLGLFTLNLQNYILTLRAAYSYFNLMSSLN